MKKQWLSVLIATIFAISSICVYANVTFDGKDTTTKGNWVGKYGKNGAILFGRTDQKDLKDITKFTDNGQRWDWANPTPDERGLISIDDPNVRIGNCMYNNPVGLITVETALDSYQATLFVIDWDSTARIEELVGYQGNTAPAQADVTVENPDFNAGIYYKWLVTGKELFNIQITHKGGANWVVSGFFVDAISISAVQSSGKLASTWGGIRAGN